MSPTQNHPFSVFTLKSLWLVALTVLSPLSEAKIHIEPYAGWSWAVTNAQANIDDTMETFIFLKEGKHYTGPTTGMRLGYSSLGLAVGVDFTIGRWTSVYKEGFQKIQNHETLTALLPGIFVSYKLPLMFRAYASMIPFSTVQFAGNNTSAKYCKQSRGVKLGVSYLSIPFLSVNFEYLPLYIYGHNCNTWSHTGTAYVNFIF